MVTIRENAEKDYEHSMTEENFIALQAVSAKARRLFSKKKKDGRRGF